MPSWHVEACSPQVIVWQLPAEQSSEAHADVCTVLHSDAAGK